MSQNESNSFLKYSAHFLIGGTFDAVQKTIIAPIERVKLLLQTQAVNRNIQSGEIKRYSGIFNAFMRITKEEGFRSLWRGNLASVLIYIPREALNFGFRHFSFTSRLNPYNPQTERTKYFLGSLAAGGATGAISTIFIYPFEFVRTRLAADIGLGKQREFNGVLDCFSKVFKNDGFKGLYRGFLLQIGHQISYRAVYFGLHDFQRGIGISRGNFLQQFLIAQLVTMLAGAISYPIDTMRRRMMMQSGRADILYTSALDCFSKIYKNEGGLRPFFNGCLCNIFKSYSGALMLVLIENFKQ